MTDGGLVEIPPALFLITCRSKSTSTPIKTERAGVPINLFVIFFTPQIRVKFPRGLLIGIFVKTFTIFACFGFWIMSRTPHELHPGASLRHYLTNKLDVWWIAVFRERFRKQAWALPKRKTLLTSSCSLKQNHPTSQLLGALPKPLLMPVREKHSTNAEAGDGQIPTSDVPHRRHEVLRNLFFFKIRQLNWLDPYGFWIILFLPLSLYTLADNLQVCDSERAFKLELPIPNREELQAYLHSDPTN